MARQRTAFRSSKSIAGTVLVGFGMFLLYEHLAGAAVWLSYVLCANCSDRLGVLPAFVLAVSQVLRVHAANHEACLQGFVQHLLVSAWPLLLVTIGTVLSRRTCTQDLNHVPKKIVDLSISRPAVRQ